VRQVAERPLSDEGIDKLYEKHLLEIELVQIEQGFPLVDGQARMNAEGMGAVSRPSGNFIARW
jgi:hypothetical protein